MAEAPQKASHPTRWRARFKLNHGCGQRGEVLVDARRIGMQASPEAGRRPKQRVLLLDGAFFKTGDLSRDGIA